MHAVYNYSGFVDLIVDRESLARKTTPPEAAAPPTSPENTPDRQTLRKTPPPDEPEG